MDIRLGDALETLKTVERDVSVVFLDGWKELYLPVLRLLEPALQPGALVVADDIDLFPDALKPYLDYVRDPAHGYVSVAVPVGDTMELRRALADAFAPDVGRAAWSSPGAGARRGSGRPR